VGEIKEVIIPRMLSKTAPEAVTAL